MTTAQHPFSQPQSTRVEYRRRDASETGIPSIWGNGHRFPDGRTAKPDGPWVVLLDGRVIASGYEQAVKQAAAALAAHVAGVAESPAAALAHPISTWPTLAEEVAA